MKNIQITKTESDNLEFVGVEYCPICGAISNGDTHSWDYVSNQWCKAPLLCGHGFRFTENMNTTFDASNDDWQSSIVIFERCALASPILSRLYKALAE